MNFKPNSAEHFFNRSFVYRRNARDHLLPLMRYIPSKKLKGVLGKLQINIEEFNEDQFIQLACELTMTGSMFNKYPNGFIYEKPGQGNRDIDFSFNLTNLTFNIEVKCFTKPNKQPINQKTQLMISGPQLDSTAYKLIEKNHGHIAPIRSRHSSIIDFLNNAKEKFEPQQNQDEFNILAICCHDENDFSDSLNSVAGDFGLAIGRNLEFRKESPKNIDVENYKSIDAILITNLAQNHANFMSKRAINSWLYGNGIHFFIPLRNNENLSKNGLEIKQTFDSKNDGYIHFCKRNELRKNDFFSNIPKYFNYLRSLEMAK